ncbi:MAG: shikimate dehydrogenase [bacterium]
MKKFALVGHPLNHSLAPTLFNAGFKTLGLDYVYMKEDINITEIKTVIAKVRSGEYSGLAITSPYKEEILKYVDELTAEAREIKSVNTIFLSLDGKVTGENADWLGFLKVLIEHKVDMKNKKFLIYGAGGAARACLYAFGILKDNLFLTNRSEEKGKKLAEEFDVKFVKNNNLPAVDFLINATSSAFNSKDDLIVPEDWLKNVSVVFDLTYGDTLLTRTAKRLGLETLDAKEMLLYQAIRQFEIFTGKTAPIEDMRKSLKL